MSETAPTPHPRLPWRRDTQRLVQPAYIARPLGETLRPNATIDSGNGSNSLSWCWRAAWPGRFFRSGLAASKQAAADAATDAFWDAIAATPDWTALPDLVVPPIIGTFCDFSDEALEALAHAHQLALAFGNVPSIEGDKDQDQKVYSAALTEIDRRRGT